jgi:alpha-ketoglutarate-dependent taurine dioxygenase
MTLSGPRRQLFEALLRDRGLAAAGPASRIGRRADASRAPLSHNQEGLLFLDQLHAGGAHYSVPAAVRLEGSLDHAALERALRQLLRRHESLRTSFRRRDHDREPEQVIAPATPLDLSLKVVGLGRSTEAALHWVLEESRRPFDLESGPVFRAELLRLREDMHVLWLNMHHIVSDGWSLSIIARELFQFYELFRRGEPVHPAEPVQFGDYAAWERQPARGEELAHGLRFWIRSLDGATDRPLLPSDRPRPQIPSFEGAHLGFELDRDLVERVRHLGAKEQLTPFVILQTAFRVLLLHWTRERDTVVGSALANRDSAELHDTVGYLVNTMPLRVGLEPARSVRRALAEMRELMLTVAEHQSVPFQMLVAALRPDRSPGSHPLYQLVFDVLTPEHNPAYLGYGLGAPLGGARETGSLRLSPFEFDSRGARFDLAVFVWVLPNSIRGTAEYSTDLFERATIQTLVETLNLIVREMTVDLDIGLDALLERLEIRVRDHESRRARAYRETLGGIGKVKRRAVPTRDIVRTGVLQPGSPLPLVIEPATKDVSLLDWARESRDRLERDVLEHGAILFRGFRVESVAQFEEIIGACSDSGAVEYHFRASPRSEVSGNIYTSTDYPAEQSIFPHNEHSYSPVFPLRIFLHCVLAPELGGETPIGDCRRLLSRLTERGIRERFARKGGITYVRNYNDGFGLPWQRVFQTEERSRVEEYCREHGITWEWKDGNRLRTRQVGPAVVRHPRTGEEVWFNHGTFFHVTTLPQEIRKGLLETFSEEDLPTNTFYGDGDPIEGGILEELRSAYLEGLVEFRWQPGDILMVDNILTVHARNPYEGPRRVVVGMAEPTSWTEIGIS